MGLDMWFREDVARLLASTREAMTRSLGAVSPLDAEAADAYRQGFDDALETLAVAFGVRPPGRTSQGGYWPGLGSGPRAADLLPFPTDVQRWW